MRRLTIIISAFLLCNKVSAQISLESYTERVVAYSITLQQATLRGESEEWELRRIRREPLPEIGLDRSANIDFAHRGKGRAWGWVVTNFISKLLSYDCLKRECFFLNPSAQL